jgi:kumamolisin
LDRRRWHQRGRPALRRRRRPRRPEGGQSLGAVNPALYRLAATGAGDNGITAGANNPDGYPATPGYDLASGWGTVDAARFVPALAKTAG